ncbi:MAG: endopeptidase La [Gammaproteobacteria bacterium]|nr:endopeptidase La [Gammaproteobacteria bacterium]
MSENDPLEPEILFDDDPSTELEVASKVMPTRIYLLPVAERPFFPAQAMPVLLDHEPWLETVEKIEDTPQHVVGLCLATSPDLSSATPNDFYEMGTLVRMHHPAAAKDKIQFIAEGLQRFRIKKWLSTKPPYEVLVEYPDEVMPRDNDKVKAYAMAIINTLKELIPLNPLYSEELRFFLDRFSPNEPAMLADFAASLTTAPMDELQEILETVNIRQRMEKVLVLIKKEMDVAKLQAQIREQVETRMTEQQRKFFLREQLKEIQKELGIAKDDRTADVEKFQDRLADCNIPEAAQERIDEELHKLSILETGSPEYSVTRNYLDWISSLPWGKYSEDSLDLEQARAILNRDHDGLEDVKDRILEFLAVASLKGEVAGSILLLVGPPGVGKTSIGRSIAETLNRKFYRFSLGGMRDEAEIKGHRRTYIGAMPGKFVQALKDVGTANPVIMLDEIDKVGASFQGDPASALLEVLDPEQNADFLDHYLDVRFDLSKVLFVCTANQLDTIPGPLLDRMEVIRLAGYIAEEKMAIAKHHLWPKQLKKVGLKKSQVKIGTKAMRHVIDGYAREAGVRNLDKQLGRLVRKSVVKILEHKKGKQTPINLDVETVEDYLGKPMFQDDKPLEGVGLVTGLAWTAMGGATLSIEATLVHSKNRGFKLTGKLGEVMQESAAIAYSYVSSHLEQYKGDPAFFDEAYVHLHVPEGATPKDGPSAGVTMGTALLSLARSQQIRKGIAMTGELTLTGHVFPVGGIREKVIAARRVKLKELLLPKANQRDFEELPEHIKKGLKVHFVGHFDDVVEIVFPKR